MSRTTQPRRRATVNTDTEASPYQQYLAPPTPPSCPTTPRSTLGSPLSSHAVPLRAGSGGDVAAGPRRRISLSDVEVLPWLCCMTPALSLYSTFFMVLISSIFFDNLFYVLTAVLTFIAMLWISNLALSSLLGAFRLREGTSTDWHAKLQALQNEDPMAHDVMHIILLPNYCENESMLKDTLENLSWSPMARGRTRVVLAMEAREGAAGREKAERLVEATSHLFADIFATFHPENIPGEVAGKSSNTQWAYREALRQYQPILLGCDPSRVFITVGDADTHWHPQYLSAVTYQALTQSVEQRSWRIWQPPILLVRNIFSVPAMTRASSHATLIFELAALANQQIFPAFAYSAYSLTLALASHAEVDGWDVDVIAEDHHMFCKCFFASLWESAHEAKVKKPRGCAEVVIRPRCQIEPIFLPAVSYLVESSEGYFASVTARFHQARRHSQGIVELGYVLLQYARLAKTTTISGLPLRTHAAIMAIALKMHTLHITCTTQCFSLIMASVTTIIPTILAWVRSGMVLQGFGEQALLFVLGSNAMNAWGSMSAAQQTLAASFGNISGVVWLYAITCYVVILDVVEGKYYQVLSTFKPAQKMPPVAEEQTSSSDEDSEPENVEKPERGGGGSIKKKVASAPNLPLSSSFHVPAFVQGAQSWWQKVYLFVYIFLDTALVGYAAMTFYALIPGLMAGWSLLRRGTNFEYIVAVKPE